MRKTFIIGFIGLFLVGGMLTGLYLINQQTNPSSKAAEEKVVPVVLPTKTQNETEKTSESTGNEQLPTGSEKSDGGVTRAECEKIFGKREGMAEFKKECDVNKDGLINLLDVTELK